MTAQTQFCRSLDLVCPVTVLCRLYRYVHQVNPASISHRHETCPAEWFWTTTFDVHRVHRPVPLSAVPSYQVLFPGVQLTVRCSIGVQLVSFNWCADPLS